jgi:alkylhydroperoxidase/carboxymuconolactone decarboxylase family protein YurZ
VATRKKAKGKKIDRKLPKPPAAYTKFVETFPGLGEAWDRVHEASAQGPLDERARHVVKLAIAVGALREGAVRSAARKARAVGVSEEEIRQVIALAASVIGFPATVAVFSWIESAR